LVRVNVPSMDNTRNKISSNFNFIYKLFNK
jgi:hypothetical protein